MQGRLRERADAGLGVLVRFETPSHRRWPIGLAAGLGLGVPLVVGVLTGRPEWGVTAAGGGFLAVYLGGHPGRVRRRLLPLVALVMMAAAAVGVLTAGGRTSTVVGVWVVAVVTSWVCLRLRTGPPGPLMPVLVAGIAGVVSAPTGSQPMSAGPILGLLAAGLAFTYLVACVEAPPGGRLAARIAPADHPEHVDVLRRLRTPLDHAAVTVLRRLWAGSTVALLLLLAYPQGQAYWLFLTVVAVLQAADARHLTLGRAVHRVLGTLGGIGVFAVLDAAPLPLVAVAVLVGLLQFGVEMLNVRHYGLALLLVTPGALLLATVASGGSGTAPVGWRVLDTVLGAGIAIGVVLVEMALTRPRPS